MRRLCIRLALALASLLLISIKFVDVTIGAGFGRHPAEAAWTAIGIAAESFSLDYWLTVPPLAAGKDLKTWAQKLGARLGASQDAVCAGRIDRIAYANLSGLLDRDADLVLTIQSEPETAHIGVSCHYSGMPSDLIGLERRIRLGLAEAGRSGEFSWTIRGRVKGRLGDEDWRAMWSRVLAAVKGTRRDPQAGGGFISAYTPLLPPGQGAVAGRGANLVMAREYDSADRTTLIMMASPDLAGEA